MPPTNPWVPPIGKRYDLGHRLVEADDMTAYANATSDDSITYYGHDAIAPPMLHVRLMRDVLFAIMEDQELGLDRLRLLHASHDARFYRPLHPGDVVAIRGLLDRVDQKKTGLLVTGRLYGFVAGDLAVEATTVFFVRGDHRLDLEAVAHPATSQPDGGASELGPPHTTVSWTVAPDQSTRYAEASLDHNPLHVDPEAALQAGFANLTVHGLCTQAMAGHSILKHLAWNDARSLGRLAARFRRPVFNNSQLTTRMWVHGERVDFDVIDPNGVVVLSDGIAEIAGLGQ